MRRLKRPNPACSTFRSLPIYNQSWSSSLIHRSQPGELWLHVEEVLPDPLHLSLWFPTFSEQDMMLHVLAVLQQFPFSAQRPGVTYVSVHPVSWNEPTILERRFNPGVSPEVAVEVAADLLHE